MSEEGKESSHHSHHRHHHHHRHHDEEQKQDQPPPPPPPAQYGTFQGVSNYPPQPAMGFPQPVPPPGASDHPPPNYYAHGYQAVPGYAVAEGTPIREQRLPCCGCGLGWFLFIIGFFLAGIPWYVAAFILLCAKVDPREKPGYITCTVAAVLATIAIILGVTKRHW